MNLTNTWGEVLQELAEQQLNKALYSNNNKNWILQNVFDKANGQTITICLKLLRQIRLYVCLCVRVCVCEQHNKFM